MHWLAEMLIYHLPLCNLGNSSLFSSRPCVSPAQTAAVFSLSCSVTAVAQPAAGQLSSQRWRESIARRRRSLPGTAVCCPPRVSRLHRCSRYTGDCAAAKPPSGGN